MECKCIHFILQDKSLNTQLYTINGFNNDNNKKVSRKEKDASVIAMKVSRVETLVVDSEKNNFFCCCCKNVEVQ